MIKYYILNGLSYARPDTLYDTLYSPMAPFRKAIQPDFGTQESPCRNGDKIDLSLNWLHVQAQAGFTATNAWSTELALGLSRVSYELDRMYNLNEEGDYDNERIDFSLTYTIDKEQVYSEGFNTAYGVPIGQCNRPVYDNLKYSSLQCPCASYIDDIYSCSVIQRGLSAFRTERSNYYHRQSVFDPVMDHIQILKELDSTSPPKYDLDTRVITITTDECARFSGRTHGLNPEQQSAYWGDVDPESVEKWKINPGITSDGAVIESDCEKRDYPTPDELFQGLKDVNAGLLILMTNDDVFTNCADINDYDKDTFYAHYLRNVAEKYGVKYAYYHWSDYKSLTESLLYGLVEVMDPCRDSN